MVSPSRDKWSFPIFLSAPVLLAILAMAPGNVEGRLLPGILLAVVFCWWSARSTIPTDPGAGLFGASPFPPVSTAVALAFLATALFLRFVWPTSLHGWPLEDEGMNGFLALDLSRHWRWDPFLFFTQIPPLFFWIHGLFFKAVAPSLSSLWLFPSLLSLATAGIAFWAARAWFEKQTATWAVLLWSCSFWPAYVGRFDTLEGFLLLWEVSVLGVLGWWWKRRNGPRAGSASLILGLAAGIGFWISHHGPFVILLLTVAAAAGTLRGSGRKARAFFLYLTGLLVLTAPILAAQFSNDFGFYVRSLLAGSAGMSPWDSLKEGARYVAAVFWGANPASFAFRPYGSGYLNPILGALALLGLGTAFARFRSDSARFLLLGAALGLIPGFLTRLTEFFRISHVIPFLLLSAMAGLARLLASIPPARRTAVLLSLLAVSATWDLAHLARVRDNAGRIDRPWKNASRSLIRARAFEILRAWSRENGPGVLWSQLAPDPWDGSLEVAVQPFSTDPDRASWGAVILESDLLEGLQKTNADGRLVPLGDFGDPPQSLALWIQPKTSVSADDRFNRWTDADRVFLPVVREHIAHKEGRGRIKILGALREAEPAFHRDRILESLYWLRVSDFYYVQTIAGFYHPEILGPGDPRMLRFKLLDEQINALMRSETAYPNKFAQERLSDLLAIRKGLKRPAGRKSASP